MNNRATKSDTIAGVGGGASTTVNESYSVDAANRLTSRTVSGASTTVTSDADGNVLTDGTRTNTWDSQNRLVSCATSGTSGTTSAFKYGSDGLRRRGTVTASDGTYTRTDYIYDAQMLVEEVVQHFSSTGTALDTPTTITYFQGPQGPLYRKSSTEADPSWYVYDGLGSVVGEVNAAGSVTASDLYDVYGARRGYSGTPTTSQGFVGGLGHETDSETGLLYMRARYYDPGAGRFIGQDPSENGTNWFAYCKNNPTNQVDESGKSPYDQDQSFMTNLLRNLGQTFGIFFGVTLTLAALGCLAFNQLVVAAALVAMAIGSFEISIAGSVAMGGAVPAGDSERQLIVDILAGSVSGGAIACGLMMEMSAKEALDAAGGTIAAAAIMATLAYGMEALGAAESVGQD